MGRTSAINPTDICQASDILCTFAVNSVEVEACPQQEGVWLCLCQLWCRAAGEAALGPPAAPGGWRGTKSGCHLQAQAPTLEWDM